MKFSTLIALVGSAAAVAISTETPLNDPDMVQASQIGRTDADADADADADHTNVKAALGLKAAHFFAD
jgi:hypothetical protein